MIRFVMMDEPFRQLLQLTKLRDGWNFGEGKAPTLTARISASAVIHMALDAGATKFEFFPEDEGGILVIAYRGAESTEILARSDGKFEFAFENAAGLSNTQELTTIAEISAELEERGWQSPRSFGSFTRVITANERVATPPPHLDPAEAVSLSLIPDASLTKGIRFVPMRNVITSEKFADHPQYFGASKPQNLLHLAS
jgi:hypothetical protein